MIPKIHNELQSEKFQSWFLNEYPQKAKELEKVGINQKIKEKYPDIFDSHDLGLL